MLAQDAMKQEHSISTGSAYPDSAMQPEGGVARMAGYSQGGPAIEDDALGGGSSPHLPGAAALEAETPPRYPLMRKVCAALSPPWCAESSCVLLTVPALLQSCLDG